MTEPPAPTTVSAWVVRDRRTGRVYTGPVSPSPRFPAFHRAEDAYMMLARAETEEPLGHWEVTRIELDPRGLPNLGWPQAYGDTSPSP